MKIKTKHFIKSNYFFHYRKSMSFFITGCMICLFFACNEKDLKRKSPNGKVSLEIMNSEEGLTYEISVDGKKALLNGQLGLISQQGDLSIGSITHTEKNKNDTSYSPLYAQNSNIRNHYNELAVGFRSQDNLDMNIRFRVYNDGVAFRYEIPGQEIKNMVLEQDLTTFHFDKDYPARRIKYRDLNSDFRAEPISEIAFSKPPMVVDMGNSWLAINEAAIYDMSMMYLVNPERNTTMQSEIGYSEITLPAHTPWRVIQIGEKAKDLIESNLLLNLNKPAQKSEFSWVKPGKALSDWRNRGDTVNGFVYGTDMLSYKRMIDFASDNSIEYVTVSDGWYAEVGPTQPREGIDLQEIIEYARTRDVEILLYLDRRQNGKNNDWDLEEVLKTYHKWGIAGIKYGFLSFDYNVEDASAFGRQKFVRETWRIIKMSAKYKLFVNLHDHPVHPGGERVTWPNKITTEFGHAQQDARRSFGPRISVSVPFFNGISGPIDMSNGYYDLNELHHRLKVDKSGINSTVAGETARCMIHYTPLLMLPDNGDEYNKKADLFDFIREMPLSWDESRVLEGKPEDYIIFARRSGSDWYVAGNTDENERSFQIPLDFLGSGEYDITLYLDAPDTHYVTNKEAYEVKKIKGTKNSVLDIYMAPGGGFSMKIIK